MGIFNKLFDSKKTEIEKLLEDKYAKNHLDRKLIREAIAQCKSESKNEGTDNLPENYGDYLISQSNAGNEECKKFVAKTILGGANEDDIRCWWNLTDLERRMIRWEDNISRISAFKIFEEDGLSEKEAIMKVKKSFPIYGDPSDESKMQGDDRPLPNELHDRINRMTTELPLIYFQQYLKDYTSMNAFIRSELKMHEQK